MLSRSYNLIVFLFASSASLSFVDGIFLRKTKSLRSESLKSPIDAIVDTISNVADSTLHSKSTLGTDTSVNSCTCDCCGAAHPPPTLHITPEIDADHGISTTDDVALEMEDRKNAEELLKTEAPKAKAAAEKLEQAEEMKVIKDMEMKLEKNLKEQKEKAIKQKKVKDEAAAAAEGADSDEDGAKDVESSFLQKNLDEPTSTSELIEGTGHRICAPLPPNFREVSIPSCDIHNQCNFFQLTENGAIIHDQPKHAIQQDIFCLHYCVATDDSKKVEEGKKPPPVKTLTIHSEINVDVNKSDSEDNLGITNPQANTKTLSQSIEICTQDPNGPWSKKPLEDKDDSDALPPPEDDETPPALEPVEEAKPSVPTIDNGPAPAPAVEAKAEIPPLQEEIDKVAGETKKASEEAMAIVEKNGNEGE